MVRFLVQSKCARALRTLPRADQNIKKEPVMNLRADPNAWRQESPGSLGWTRSPHPGAPNKYFVVSADCHAQEPNDFLSQRMPAQYRDRLPGIILNSVGEKVQKTEGFRPM